MDKFTKEPWLLDGTMIYALHVPPDPFFKNGVAQECNRFSASVQASPRQGIPQEEIEANARLMQSAPKLLKALKKIASLWPEPTNCADIMSVNGINDGRSRAIVADAAIKIARQAITEIDKS